MAMTKKKESKKSFGWISSVLDFLGGIAEKIIEKSDYELEKVKRQVIHYVVVYGLFTIALFFILIGIIKYLAEIYVFASEGIGFIIIGSIMIVVLAAYSMIKRI
jgi:hypothetical protein